MFLVVHLPTYLPTYQPTRQPTSSVSPPSPPRYPSLCVRASPRDIIPSLFHYRSASRLLHQLGLLSSLSLFSPITFFSPAPFHRLGVRHSDRDHAARSPVPDPSVRSRDAVLLTDTLGLLTTVHTASSRRRVSCTVSPHRATPRHDSPRSRLDEPRLAASRVSRISSRAFADIPLRPRGSPTGGISHASREDLDKEHQTIAGRC